MAPGIFELNDGAEFRNEETGRVHGIIHFMGGIVINKGYMAPGLSPGSITIDGDFVQEAGGELVIELGGSEAGVDYDQFIVNGTATLGGCLRIVCLDDDFPAAGTMYNPIMATTIVGSFDEVIIDVPSGRQTFDVAMTETGFTAEAMVLDISDFSGWQSGVFSEVEQADPSISGFDADPDGYSNLMEYVFDGNPKALTQSLVNMANEYGAEGNRSGVVVDFPWAKDVTDSNYKLQFSSDLVVWTDLASTVIDSVDQGLVTRITLSADLPGEASEFVRLVVTRE